MEIDLSSLTGYYVRLFFASHWIVVSSPSWRFVPEVSPNSFRAFVVSARLRAISPVRGGLNLNSLCDPLVSCIISASFRIVVSFPDAMLKTLLVRSFSSAATVALTTSET